MALPALCLQVIERREEFDFTRHAAFCAFGFAYLGGFQYWLYNIKFTQVGAAPGAARCVVRLWSLRLVVRHVQVAGRAVLAINCRRGGTCPLHPPTRSGEVGI